MKHTEASTKTMRVHNLCNFIHNEGTLVEDDLELSSVLYPSIVIGFLKVAASYS